MKTATFALAAVSLLQLAAAQPHGAHHKHKHPQRDLLVENVVVLVDPAGNPVSTSTGASSVQTDPPAAPAPAPAAAATPVKPAELFASPRVSTTSSTTAPKSSTSSASTAARSNASVAPGGGSGSGLVYSPYSASGGCKDAGTIASDFAKITGYGFIRLYGVDCNQVAAVLPLAKAKGMTVFASVFDIAQSASEAKQLIAQVGGNWASISAVGVGNESVNKGEASPATVVATLQSVKATLKAAGYSGPVVAPEVFSQLIAHPEICQASDYAAANTHPFFDPNTSASQAGTFVKTQQGNVQKACGKQVIISETGWPHQGSANGQAVPSPANQQTALASIKAAFASDPQDFVILGAFDDLWKKNSAGTFGAEQYWGVLGS